jgi:ribose transport system permease protein
MNVKTTGLAAASPEPNAISSRLTSLVDHLMGQMWAVYFLAALVVVFSVIARGFCDLFNFQAVGANMAVLLVLGLGQTFVIISGGIDLSTGFVMGLASVAGSVVMQMLLGYPLPVVLLAGFVATFMIGLCAGAVNGVLVARLKVPPFIATLGTYGVAQGLAYVISGGPPVSVGTRGLGFFGNGFVLYYHPTAGISVLGPPVGVTGTAMRDVIGIVPLQVLYVVLAAAFCGWLLGRTRFGRHVYAVGGNPKAASRAGIPLGWILFKIYVLSSLFASLAGFLYVLRFNGGVANAGDALMMSSIAAIAIGGASLFGGEGKILGTVVGALIIAVIQNGLVILGIDPFWQYVAVGVVIILAVLVDQAKGKFAK